MDCTHCKQKGGVLAYCSKGQWQKANGEYKRVSLAYLPNSRLAMTATYCDFYEGEDEDLQGVQVRSGS